MSWIFWNIIGYLSKEEHQHYQILLTFLNVVAVSLGVSANNRPVFSPLRVFFCILALYALTITAIYTSKLITVFTNPKLDHQIDTIEELLEIGIPIGGRLENMDWFENEDELDGLIFDRYNHTQAFRPSTSSLRSIKGGEIALLISKLYVRSNKYRNSVHGITQSMFANNIEMIVERGFPLLKRINEILSALRDNGFMNKLFDDFKFNMTILTPIRELRANSGKGENTYEESYDTEEILDSFDDEEESDEKTESPEVVLTIEHLEGAFTIWIMGLILSSSIFVFETFYHCKVLRKFLKLTRKVIVLKFFKHQNEIVPSKIKEISKT